MSSQLRKPVLKSESKRNEEQKREAELVERMHKADACETAEQDVLDDCRCYYGSDRCNYCEKKEEERQNN